MVENSAFCRLSINQNDRLPSFDQLKKNTLHFSQFAVRARTNGHGGYPQESTKQQMNLNKALTLLLIPGRDF